MAKLFLVVFSIMAAFALLLPSVMFFLENLGASKGLATKILACYSLAQFLAGPLMGRLSDHTGRKAALVSGLAVAVLAYAWLAMSEPSLWGAFLGFSVAGIASGVVAVAFAAVTDLTNEKNRAKGMGMIGAAIGLAFTVGPAVGAFLGSAKADTATIAVPATGSVLILVLGLFFAAALPKQLGKLAAQGHETLGRIAGFRALAGKPVLINLALMMFVFTSALALMEPVMPYLIRDRYEWGPRELGSLFAFAGFIIVIVQGGLVGRLTKRFGEYRLLVTGISLMGAGLALLIFAPTSAFIWGGLMFTSVGGALFNTSALALASMKTDTNNRGLIMGAVQSMQSLGRSGGPMLAGNLYQVSMILPLAVGMTAMMLSLVWVGLLKINRG